MISIIKINYIKRFIIETSTLDKEFHFLDENSSMRLLLVTLNEGSIFKFNYHSVSGRKKTKEIDVDGFVGVKGWKSIGNKVPQYKRMSAYEIFESDADKIETHNKEEKLDISSDNPDSDTLNLFE